MKNLKNMTAKITRNGNLIVDKIIVNADGKFVRRISDEEKTYFDNLNMLEVVINSDIQIAIPEKWRYWFSTRDDDYTNYEADRCNNGGCYGSWIRNHFYIRRNGDEIEVLRLEVPGDTSDWRISIDGSHDDYSRGVEFLDAEPYRIEYGFSETMDVEYVYVQDSSHYGDCESIERFAQRTDIKAALYAQSSYVDQDTNETYDILFKDFAGRIRKACSILNCTPNELIGRRSDRYRMSKMRRRPEYTYNF